MRKIIHITFIAALAFFASGCGNNGGSSGSATTTGIVCGGDPAVTIPSSATIVAISGTTVALNNTLNPIAKTATLSVTGATNQCYEYTY